MQNMERKNENSTEIGRTESYAKTGPEKFIGLFSLLIEYTFYSYLLTAFIFLVLVSIDVSVFHGARIDELLNMIMKTLR